MKSPEYDDLGHNELLAIVDALHAAKSEADRASCAKSMFLASVAHDLRQPVQSLVLLLDHAEREIARRSRAGNIVAMMKLAVDAMQGLLDSTLDISRIDAGGVAPMVELVDVGSLLERLENEYALRAAHKGLRLRSAPRRMLVRTDPHLLNRVLRNLLENALRYTQTGGVLLGARRRGDRVRVDVFDTGVGVPADQQAKIFEEFHQLGNPSRNGQGHGLGLAIVARLATALSAKIEVASKVGRGSRFSLLLPADETATALALCETLPPAESDH